MRGDTTGQFNYPRLLCWDPLTSLGGSGSGALIVANTDSNEVVAWNTNASGFPSVVWAKGALFTPYGVASYASTRSISLANNNRKGVAVLYSDGSQAGTMGTGKKCAFGHRLAR